MAKVSKASVNYRPAATKARRCGTCAMFRRAAGWATVGGCTLVSGGIRAGDVCDRWEKRR